MTAVMSLSSKEKQILEKLHASCWQGSLCDSWGLPEAETNKVHDQHIHHPTLGLLWPPLGESDLPVLVAAGLVRWGGRNDRPHITARGNKFLEEEHWRKVRRWLVGMAFVVGVIVLGALVI